MSAQPVNSGAAAAAGPQLERRCSICDTTLKKVMHCGQCGIEWAVCGKVCQRADWPRHKLDCQTRDIATATRKLEHQVDKLRAFVNAPPHSLSDRQKCDEAARLLGSLKQQREELHATLADLQNQSAAETLLIEQQTALIVMAKQREIDALTTEKQRLEQKSTLGGN